MNKRAWGAAAIFLLLGTALRGQQAQPQQQQPAPSAGQSGAIVRSVNLVDVLFSATNKRGKLITDLNKEDFQVFDDGVRQQITSFSQPSDLPLRIGLLLDTSNSIRDRLKFEQDAAVDFLFNTLRHEKDQAFLMTFDDGPQLIQEFNGDAGALRDTILKQRAGGGTALYDAVYAGADHVLNHAPLPAGANPEVRRVLVVISDGDDNNSDRALAAAIEMAQRAGVIIYSISTNTQWMNVTNDTNPNPGRRIEGKYNKDEGDRVLEQLAAETGGRSFFPYREEDLGQSFLDIGDELRHQYALAYSPAGRVPDGKFHSIRIQVARKDVNIHARKGYYLLPTTPNSGG